MTIKTNEPNFVAGAGKFALNAEGYSNFTYTTSSAIGSDTETKLHSASHPVVSRIYGGDEYEKTQNDTKHGQVYHAWVGRHVFVADSLPVLTVEQVGSMLDSLISASSEIKETLKNIPSLKSRDDVHVLMASLLNTMSSLDISGALRYTTETNSGYMSGRDYSSRSYRTVYLAFILQDGGEEDIKAIVKNLPVSAQVGASEIDPDVYWVSIRDYELFPHLTRDLGQQYRSQVLHFAGLERWDNWPSSYKEAEELEVEVYRLKCRLNGHLARKLQDDWDRVDFSRAGRACRGLVNILVKYNAPPHLRGFLMEADMWSIPHTFSQLVEYAEQANAIRISLPRTLTEPIEV